MTPLLDVRHLSVAGEVPVLRSISLTVGSGEVHGLVGESGAGKTSVARTILRILPSSLRVTGGVILFEGRDLVTMSEGEFGELLGNDIALIPQDPQSALNPSRRIGDQLIDSLRYKRGLRRAEAIGRAKAMLGETLIRDVEKVIQRYPHELSGGMRQRVLIAQAFMLEPKLIIADEPTTALDVTVQKQILRLIRQLQERHGTAIVFVTHDLGVVAQICSRMTVLYGGMLIEQGATSDLLSHPSEPYTKALLAANPHYDRPRESLRPVPPGVIAELRQRIGQ